MTILFSSWCARGSVDLLKSTAAPDIQYAFQADFADANVSTTVGSFLRGEAVLALLAGWATSTCCLNETENAIVLEPPGP